MRSQSTEGYRKLSSEHCEVLTDSLKDTMKTVQVFESLQEFWTVTKGQICNGNIKGSHGNRRSLYNIHPVMISIGIPLLSINSRSTRLFWPDSCHVKDTVVSIATWQCTKRWKIPQFNTFSPFWIYLHRAWAGHRRTGEHCSSFWKFARVLDRNKMRSQFVIGKLQVVMAIEIIIHPPCYPLLTDTDRPTTAFILIADLGYGLANLNLSHV